MSVRKVVDYQNFIVFPDVYPPSGDTYLLLDSIRITSDDEFLEVGCGAGLITLKGAERARSAISIDVSIDAVRNTKENLRRNGLDQNCAVFQSDLLSSIDSSTKFSLIVFNPPYLPDDDMSTNLDHALIGGHTGAEVTQRFIPQAANHLIKGGRVYVVVSTLADSEAIWKTMSDCSLSVEIVSEEPQFFEKIQVFKGTR
ncbi:MAG: methyltransferase domain-containing protein [Candidatus Thorarchaeota archaeon]|nr:MAG: methyltransferase domain-containing protein [Candidatus Thorarchaeota archaeon]